MDRWGEDEGAGGEESLASLHKAARAEALAWEADHAGAAKEGEEFDSKHKVEQAVIAVKTRVMSQREAEKAFDVPRRTIREYVSSRKRLRSKYFVYSSFCSAIAASASTGWAAGRIGRPPATTVEFVALMKDNKRTLDQALKGGEPWTAKSFHEDFNQARRDAAGILGFEVKNVDPRTSAKHRKLYLTEEVNTAETQSTPKRSTPQAVSYFCGPPLYDRTRRMSCVATRDTAYSDLIRRVHGRPAVKRPPTPPPCICCTCCTCTN